ncbi:MAG: response regulator [Pseudomonadota bacterium]
MTDAEATSRRRIYIVDDQDFVVAMITKFLEAGNFDIRSTTDSAVAEQQIADWKPDAVIVDIMMPGLNGLEMIRRLKAEHGLQDSKFLVVTSKPMQEFATTAKAAGADGFLTKPVTKDQLLQYLSFMVPKS